MHVELNFSSSFQFGGNTVKKSFYDVGYECLGFPKRLGARNQQGALEKGNII